MHSEKANSSDSGISAILVRKLASFCIASFMIKFFPSFGEVLYRQIAGALAKRIVDYAVEGDKVTQGTDAGFIKFGSRVDVYLPLDAKVKVNLGDKVKGGVQVIAER